MKRSTMLCLLVPMLAACSGEGGETSKAPDELFSDMPDCSNGSIRMTGTIDNETIDVENTGFSAVSTLVSGKLEAGMGLRDESAWAFATSLSFEGKLERGKKKDVNRGWYWLPETHTKAPAFVCITKAEIGVAQEAPEGRGALIQWHVTEMVESTRPYDPEQHLPPRADECTGRKLEVNFKGCVHRPREVL